MEKIGSWLIWVFMYVVGLVFIINSNVIIIALYSLLFVIIYTIFEPILREGMVTSFPSGKDSGFNKHDDVIATLLQYYEEREVVEWCIKNYKWSVEKATKRVSGVVEKLEKCGK